MANNDDNVPFENANILLEDDDFTMEKWLEKNGVRFIEEEANTEPPAVQVLPPVLGLQIGSEFTDVLTCRSKMKDIAIHHGFEMQISKSDNDRFTAKCAAEGCNWRIHIAKDKRLPTFTVRTFTNVHNCSGHARIGSHHQATVQWISNAVRDILKQNPNCKTTKEFQEQILINHGLALNDWQVWRGKNRCLATLREEFEEEYRLLPEYCYLVKKTNPGSVAEVGSLQGFFTTCRPLLGLDRIPLKGQYQGALFFATGFDGDGGAFLFAFAIVNEETNENWMWFVSEVQSMVEIYSERSLKLTLLSPENHGISSAVNKYFPSAFHGVCMQHFSDCFQKKFEDIQLVKLLWDAAKACTKREFDSKMLDIMRISSDAYIWIKEITDSRKWATAHFGGTRLGQLTCSDESLNAMLLQASTLPPIQLLEAIRSHQTSLFKERRKASVHWTTTLVPSAEKHISAAEWDQLIVNRMSESEFGVELEEKSVVVNISTRRCSCQGWQLLGLPCVHAIAALKKSEQDVDEFAESYFTSTNFMNTYSEEIIPVPERDLWKVIRPENLELVEIVPPKQLPPSQSPEPKKRRARRAKGGPSKRVMHCSRCHEAGHHRTTCRKPL